MPALHAGTLACCMLHVACCSCSCMGSCSDRVTLQPITCFIIGPSKRQLARKGCLLLHCDIHATHGCKFHWVIFTFTFTFAGGACDASSGTEFGIKCQKVTRRVASTRKLCNILLNVSISVSLLLIWPKLSPFFGQVSFAVLGPRMPRRQGSHSNSNNTNNNNIERHQQSDNNDRRRWQVAARLDSVVLAQNKNPRTTEKKVVRG